MSCHSRAGVWLLLPTPSKKGPVDGQLIQFLTHDEGFGVVIQPSAVGVRQLGSAATSIPAPPVSATLSPTTPVSPHHPTIYYYWDASTHSWSPNPPPADTKSWSPSAVSDTIKSPSPLFGFFIARITKVDHHTPPSCMNGHVSGLEEGLRGGKQSPQLKAVKDEGLDEAALELNGSNRRISCDKWSAWQPKHQQTSLHKADCSYPLVVSHIEAKAQNGICPEKGVF